MLTGNRYILHVTYWGSASNSNLAVHVGDYPNVHPSHILGNCFAGYGATGECQSKVFISPSHSLYIQTFVYRIASNKGTITIVDLDRPPLALPNDQSRAPRDALLCGGQPPQHYCADGSCNGTSGGADGTGDVGTSAVNTFSGNYNYQPPAYTLSTPGQPLQFQFTYNSDAALGGASGWIHSYDTRLIFPGTPGGETRTTILQSPQGSRLRFYQRGDGTYVPHEGICASLTQSTSGSTVYTVTATNQESFIYDVGGRLIGQRDARGNATSFIYDTNNRLDRVLGAGNGRWLDLDYNSQNLISAVTDQAGNHIDYGYDANGNLSQMTDLRGMAWSYAYTDTHLLEEIRNPDSQVVERVLYDAQGRVTDKEDELGTSLVDITYHSNGTRVVTEAGRVTTDTYNGMNLLVRQTDALNQSREYTYDADFNLASVKDARGYSTSYQYTSSGLPAVLINSHGHRTTFRYDARNNPVAVTDTLGHVTTYTYDNHNNLLVATNPLSGTIQTQYNTHGQAIATTNPNERTTEYGYDEFGQTTTITDALGYVTTFAYDAVGRAISTTNPLGRTTWNVYDPAGNLLRRTENYLPGQPRNHDDEFNLVTEFAYDSAGRQTVVTDTLGRVAHTEYDAGRVVRTTENYLPNQPQNYLNTYNLTTTYGYDAFGRQVAVTDTLGQVTRTEFNTRGQVARTVTNYVNGVYDAAQPDEDVITYHNYDANGNLVSSWDTLGRQTRTEYDALNRVVRTIVNYQDGVYSAAQTDQDLVTTYGYDAAGNQVAVTDTLGSVTRTAYDKLSRPITVTNVLTGTTVYGYDASGNRLSVTDARGRVTRYRYDALGRAEAITDTLGGVTQYAFNAVGNQISITNARGHTSYYGYDTLGRTVAITDALGNVSHFTYDPASNRSSQTDAAGRVTRNEYDSLGRLAQTTANYVASGPVDDETNIVTTYTYDPVGRRLAVEDANSHTTHYGYDGLGRVEVITSAVGLTTTFTYDGLGNRLSVTNGANQQTTYEYDAVNRLVLIQDPMGHETQYRYDGLGNRVALVDAEGMETHYGYDALGRLTQVTENYQDGVTGSATDADVQTRYTYDAVGNRTAIINAHGYTTTFSYDGLNRQISEQDALGHTTRYSYDAIGNRSVMTDAKGVVTSFVYDGLDRLLTINYPGSQPDVNFTYDALSNRQVMTDGTGTTQYDYDALNRLVEVVDGNNQTVSYGYDPVGNRQQMTHGGTTVAYTYDPANRLQTVADGASGVYTYTYSAASQVESLQYPNGVETEYTYNAAGQLTNLEHIAATSEVLAEYEYQLDAVGNRTTITETLQSPLPSLTCQAVTWTDLGTSFTESGGDIQKTAVNGYNADALSAQQIEYGDGAVSFRIDAVNQRGVVGLDHTDSNEGYLDIDFGWWTSDPTTSSTPTLRIYEAGTQVKTFAGYAAGDLLEVRIEGGKVRYYHNGVLKYTSTKAVPYPLHLDAAIYAQGKWILEATIGRSPCETVKWTDLGTNFTETRGNVQKTAGGNSYNADALSVQQIEYGDGGASFRIDALNQRGVVGLDHTDSNESYTDIDFGWWTSDLSTSSTPILRVFENGYQMTGSLGAYAVGDLLEVRIEGGKVRYYHNGVLKYTSTKSIIYPLHVDAALYTQGKSVLQAAIGASASAALRDPTVTQNLLATGTNEAPDAGLPEPRVPVPGPNALYLPLVEQGTQSNGTPPEAPAGPTANTQSVPWTPVAARQVITYRYDGLYRLTKAEYSTGQRFGYAYDRVGNRTVLTDALGVQVYTYDAANRLTNADGQSYTWDANGNLLNDGTSSYTYNAANRLTAVTGSGTTSSYAYDGLGNRVAQTVGGVTTHYTLDVAGGLPEVLSATTGASSTRYMQVGGQVLAQQESGTWGYVLPDHLGSVRQVANGTGQVTLAQSYTPYGEVLQRVGSASSTLAFTGEPMDVTGMVHLRARHYAPRLGQFTTQDPFDGWLTIPYSQHPYQYGYSSPLLYTDPTGRQVCSMGWNNPLEALNCVDEIAAIVTALQTASGAGSVIVVTAGPETLVIAGSMGVFLVGLEYTDFDIPEYSRPEAGFSDGRIGYTSTSNDTIWYNAQGGNSCVVPSTPSEATSLPFPWEQQSEGTVVEARRGNPTRPQAGQNTDRRPNPRTQGVPAPQRPVNARPAPHPGQQLPTGGNDLEPEWQPPNPNDPMFKYWVVYQLLRLLGDINGVGE